MADERGLEDAPPAVGLDDYHAKMSKCSPDFKHKHRILEHSLSSEDEAIMMSSHQQAAPTSDLQGASSLAASSSTRSTQSDTGSSPFGSPGGGRKHEQLVAEAERLQHVAESEEEQGDRIDGDGPVPAPQPAAGQRAPPQTDSGRQGPAAIMINDTKCKTHPTWEEKLEGYVRRGFGRVARQPHQVTEGQALLRGDGHVQSKMARQMAEQERHA